MSGSSRSTSGLWPLKLFLILSTMASLSLREAKWLFLIQRQSVTVSVMANVFSGSSQFSHGSFIEYSKRSSVDSSLSYLWTRTRSLVAHLVHMQNLYAVSRSAENSTPPELVWISLAPASLTSLSTRSFWFADAAAKKIMCYSL